MKAPLAALILLTLGSVALADNLPPPAQEPAPGQGGAPPGGLTARDVTGKWLLNANGKEVGKIASVSGEQATVRTPDGRTVQVEMARLSLGNGENTVIESGNSGADRLNKMQMGH